MKKLLLGLLINFKVENVIHYIIKCIVHYLRAGLVYSSSACISLETKVQITS